MWGGSAEDGEDLGPGSLEEVPLKPRVRSSKPKRSPNSGGSQTRNTGLSAGGRGEAIRHRQCYHTPLFYHTPQYHTPSYTPSCGCEEVLSHPVVYHTPFVMAPCELRFITRGLHKIPQLPQTG